ncbi:UNKNOWN [Stylonychia lemnae]|uniref:Cyclic nucleotide-binding domain-containing protein n=1 Tax=Stylonychia lemnae TaxID=5949 RepID=A0A078A885_STYLE|nr:UNKNOWN [Stylonychia lemnae]|eukprot:CDW78470.1 UNKNOWN [Stylonychia lemnae]
MQNDESNLNLPKSRQSSNFETIQEAKLSPDQQTIISILKQSPEFRNEQDLKTLVPLVKDIKFFKEKKIKQRDLVDICQRLKYEYIAANKSAIQYGEYGDKFYIILEGLVSVWIPDSNKSKTSGQQTKENSLVQSQVFQSVTASLNTNIRGVLNSNLMQSKTIEKTISDINVEEIPEYDNLQEEKLTKSNSIKSINFREVARLSEGKTFGELALIVHKPRMATIRCEIGTHFAVLDKYDFQRCLGKLEKKQLNQIIDFLKNLQCFKSWTRNSVGKFSYFLSKQKFKRGQIVYKEGQVSDKVFIVKKGEFELQRKMKKDLTDAATDIVELMGKKILKSNILARKLPEIKDVPSNMRLTIFGIGCILGEEDILNRQTYSCSLKCHSLNGTLFVLKKQEFLLLRNQDDSWLSIIEKIIEKEKRRRADWLSDDNADKHLSKIADLSIYKHQNNKEKAKQYQFYTKNQVDVPTSVLINQQSSQDDNNMKKSSLIYFDKESPQKIMNISRLLQRSQDIRSNSRSNQNTRQMERIVTQDLKNQLLAQLPNKYNLSRSQQKQYPQEQRFPQQRLKSVDLNQNSTVASQISIPSQNIFIKEYETFNQSLFNTQTQMYQSTTARSFMNSSLVNTNPRLNTPNQFRMKQKHHRNAQLAARGKGGGFYRINQSLLNHAKYQPNQNKSIETSFQNSRPQSSQISLNLIQNNRFSNFQYQIQSNVTRTSQFRNTSMLGKDPFNNSEISRLLNSKSSQSYKN